MGDRACLKSDPGDDGAVLVAEDGPVVVPFHESRSIGHDRIFTHRAPVEFVVNGYRLASLYRSGSVKFHYRQAFSCVPVRQLCIRNGLSETGSNAPNTKLPVEFVYRLN